MHDYSNKLGKVYFQIDGNKKHLVRLIFQFLSFIWSHIIIVFSLDFGGVYITVYVFILSLCGVVDINGAEGRILVYTTVESGLWEFSL